MQDDIYNPGDKDEMDKQNKTSYNDLYPSIMLHTLITEYTSRPLQRNMIIIIIIS